MTVMSYYSANVSKYFTYNMDIKVLYDKCPNSSVSHRIL